MTAQPDSGTATSPEASLLPLGLWDRRDIAAFLRVGKSAANEVMASADFPAPVIGNRRYRRYVPDQVIAWALDRAEANAAERSRRSARP